MSKYRVKRFNVSGYDSDGVAETVRYSNVKAATAYAKTLRQGEVYDTVLNYTVFPKVAFNDDI